jgi:hypothetical protein
LSSSDPTDHALATIASILEHPEPHREPEKPPVEDKPATSEQPIKAEGYSKIGPGPMPSLRFKWTVRREDNGEYYVDETIGETSVPVVTGPLSPDAAIRLADDRASEAQQRYEQLRTEIAGRSAAANLVRKDSGEM